MLSFANPAFLWGLLGLAAPILIHLINRDLFRPLFFPSIRFIRRGKLPVERKRRLRDLLLLALRMLLFAAIVSALARPQWQPEAAAAAASNETGDELIVFIDVSASMSGWNAWEEAVAKAKELLDEHHPSPAGLVVSLAGAPLVIEPPTADHSRLRALLDNASPRQAAGDPRESFRQALRLFEGSGQRSLAIISDFQRSDWSSASLPQAAPGTQIDWIQVNRGERENAAILQARALPLPEGRRQVVAEIKNFSPSDIDRTVRLRAGDESLSRRITLAPGETESLAFVLEEPSTSRAELSMDEDAYSADDSYFLWLGRPPALRVLAIAPVTEEPETAEELFFLTRALSSRTETQWLHFAVDSVEPGGVPEEALQDVHAVFLLGAGPYLNDADWVLLREHLERGRRIFVTPGKAPARQTALLAQHDLIDLSYEGTAGVDRRRPRPHSIGWVLPDSPLDLLFRDEAARSLSNVSIYQYARLVPEHENTVTLLRTGEEDPLLMQQEARGGLVIASAFPFQTSWTDLPISTAFLPMLRELVAGELPPDHGVANLDTDRDLAGIANRLNLSPDDPAIAGLNPLRPGVHVIGNTPLVLNLPRSESLPETTNPVDLETAVSPGAAPATAAAAAANSDQRISLWPWLAMAALLFFLIEMPLAVRARRIRQGEPAIAPPVTPEPST